MSSTLHPVLSQPPERNAFHQNTQSHVSVHLHIQYHFARATPSSDDTPDASWFLCSGRRLDHRHFFFFILSLALDPRVPAGHRPYASDQLHTATMAYMSPKSPIIFREREEASCPPLPLDSMGPSHQPHGRFRPGCLHLLITPQTR